MALATTSELIRSALRNYRAQTGVSASTAASYAARLRVVLGEQRHRIRPVSRSATRRASHSAAARVLAASRQREDLGISAIRMRSRLQLPDAPAHAVREGEGAIDWGPRAQFWPRSSTHARRAQWQRQHATMSRLAFQHDSRTAQIADYASAHSRLFSRAPRAITGDQRISTLIEGLAVVYGMTPSTLSTLTQGSGPRDDSDLVIDFPEGRLWIRLPRVGYNDTLSQACAEASRSGSDWASVPLVPYLRDVARLLHTRQELAIMQSFADV